MWFVLGCVRLLPDLADPCAPFPEPGEYRVKLAEDGPNRKAYVDVPAGEGPRDLLVLLHGAGMSGPEIAEVTGFAALAAEERFVLVYPNGLGWPIRDWNAGPGFGDDDDLGFLDDLVREVRPAVCGDRTFVAGFSNGAMMAHRWACEGETTLDALGVSSGPLLTDVCLGEPMPMRHYHGLEDTLVPPGGGTGRGGAVTYPSVDDTLDAWRVRNQCAETEPTRTVTGDTTCSAYDCAASTELCLVSGFAHQWPGGANGRATDADATGALWALFTGSAD